MANITNTATVNVTATEDTTQNVIVNRTIPNLNFDSSVAQGVIYASWAGGPIALPISPAYQLYIRNNDAANNCTPTMTFHGVVSVGPTLYPGDVYLLWQKPGGANAGLTALSIAVSANCLIEYFIGG